MSHRSQRFTTVSLRLPDDAPIAAITGQPDHARFWRSLVNRIRGSDPAAAAEFHDAYAAGVQLLIRRRTGSIPASRLVEDVMRGAVEEVRRGWIREPRDLLFFVRSIAEREILASPTCTQPAASARFRIQQKTQRLDQALAKLLPAERDAMTRHYLQGVPIEQLAAETGLDPATLRKLKRRLRSEVRGDSGELEPGS